MVNLKEVINMKQCRVKKKLKKITTNYFHMKEHVKHSSKGCRYIIKVNEVI